jgi:predicted amidohydrolase
VDRFVVAGEELPLFNTPLGRIGIEICYDLRFPEATRTLALGGADLVAHPTNFPVAARLQTEFITRARAAENRVYLLTANRIGKERWGEFCGWSQIVDPYGDRLAEASADEEALLVADIDVERARDKDYVIPGEYELYLFGHRRPELYGALVKETVRA